MSKMDANEGFKNIFVSLVKCLWCVAAYHIPFPPYLASDPDVENKSPQSNAQDWPRVTGNMQEIFERIMYPGVPDAYSR